jgi:predicted esterase
MAAPDRLGDSWANPENETRVLRLLDCIRDTYAIDEKRTILTGYSLGGIGTWYIASRNQDLFSCAVPISAEVHPSALEEQWRIPVHVIHGRSDELFPVSLVEDAVRALKDRGADVTLSLVDGVTHFDTGGFVPALREVLPWIRSH